MGRGPSADFQLGLWITANSVRNNNTAKLLQKNRKQYDTADKKGPHQLNQVVVYLYC